MAGAGEVGGVQLGVGVEEGAGVGAPRVHLHTVRLTHPLERLLQLKIRLDFFHTCETEMEILFIYLDRSELDGGVAEGGWVVLAPGGVGVAGRPPQLRPAHPARGHIVRGGAGGGPVHVVRDGRPVVGRRRSADM